MIETLLYSKGYKDIWNTFVGRSKNGTFMLNRDYMDYHSDRFEDFSVMFYDKDKLLAVMPASRQGNELRSHGGLTYGGIISDENMKISKMIDIFNCLKGFLKENNISKVLYKCIPNIYHRYPSDEDLYALFLNNAVLIRRDISSTIKLQTPYKMTKGRKAQISRAKREGVIVAESDDYEQFIELENAVLSKYHNTTAIHSADELKLLHSKFPNQVKLFAAFHKDKMISASVIFIYEKLIHTQYMASNDMGRTIGALDLLIKDLIDNYSNTKEYFDFGISSENNGHSLNIGLANQKESFGGRATIYDQYNWDFSLGL